MRIPSFSHNRMVVALAAMLMAALPIAATAQSLWIRDGKPSVQARELVAVRDVLRLWL